MKVERYNHEDHVARLVDWLGQYKITVPHKEYFSDFGLVIDGIAIGFLFKGGNSKQAYIDHIAADPRVDKDRRTEALCVLFKELEEEAKREGFLMVTGLAAIPTMRTRFEAHGFKKFGEYGLYFKTIGGSQCLG